MKKKLLLFMIMLFTVFGISIISPGSRVNVQAEELQTEDGNFEYAILEDGTVEITGYTEVNGVTEIEIPGEIDGKSVTSIGYSAFEYHSGLKSITIPDSVTTIGASAFEECSSLASIEIPSSVTTIEDYAFSRCRNLESIEIPNSVTTIGHRAFFECSSLESIEIPNSVTTIKDGAFNGCSSLATIEIPSSVTTIGASAFRKTAWLTNEREKTPLVIVNGILIDGSTASGVIEVPDTVITIGDSAFNGCSSLESIEIPNSVTTIGSRAFESCSRLASIKIPSSVITIEAYAFYECSRLESIEIPNSVTTIESSVFERCSSLERVKIPSSVTTIGDCAFSECSSLESINIPSSVTNIGGMAFEDTAWLVNEQEKNPLVIVNGILIDGSTASGVIEIPDTVTTIVRGAFSGCSNLTSIEIPDSVTTIGDSAFYGCSSLKDVYYGGTAEQWKKIMIGDYNDCLINAAIHYNSSMPEKTDNEKPVTNPPAGGSNTDITKNETIALKTLSLSKTSITYTGKSQTPAVTVKDANGQPVAASGYSLTYSNNKKVGQATVTVTGKDNYTGTLTAKFNIVPKGTSLSKTTAKKKSFAVKWKKQTKETTGYEIQYSTSKNFKGAKITSVKKNNTTSVTIKNLKAKKKYYVRIRTYKTVKINGKSKKLYSGWSKAKTVTTKK